MHRYTKRKQLPVSEAVQQAGGLSLALRDVLEADRQTWTVIWEQFDGVATAPWRHLGEGWLDELTWAAPLPPLTAEGIAEVAKSYKRRTGLGTD